MCRERVVSVRPSVEGHSSGPAVPGPSQPEVLDQVQNWSYLFCEGQSKEIVLHPLSGSNSEDHRYDMGDFEVQAKGVSGACVCCGIASNHICLWC